MKWVALRDMDFFKEDKQIETLKKDTVLPQVHYSNQSYDVRTSIYNKKRTDPNNRYVVVLFNNKQRIIKIDGSLKPYSKGIGSLPKRN